MPGGKQTGFQGAGLQDLTQLLPTEDTLSLIIMSTPQGLLRLINIHRSQWLSTEMRACTELDCGKR